MSTFLVAAAVVLVVWAAAAAFAIALIAGGRRNWAAEKTAAELAELADREASER